MSSPMLTRRDCLAASIGTVAASLIHKLATVFRTKSEKPLKPKPGPGGMSGYFYRVNTVAGVLMIASAWEPERIAALTAAIRADHKPRKIATPDVARTPFDDPKKARELHKLAGQLGTMKTAWITRWLRNVRRAC